MTYFEALQKMYIRKERLTQNNFLQKYVEDCDHIIT